MRALILGGSGFIGTYIRQRLGSANSVATYHRRPFPRGIQFDVATSRVGDLLAQVSGPITHTFVLNAAVDTEACARDPIGTTRTNVEGVWRVLRDLLDAGIMPVYASTDYVFDGSHGSWRETDAAFPTTQYGIQKLEVERRLLADPRPSLVVRLSRVVGADAGYHSVLGQWAGELRDGKPMRCATDQIFSPAWVDDIAGALVALGQSGARGLFHLAGPQPYSRMELLHLLLSKIQAEAAWVVPGKITSCSLHDLPFVEKRPLNTSLAIDKVQSVIGWHFRTMDDLCTEVAHKLVHASLMQ